MRRSFLVGYGLVAVGVAWGELVGWPLLIGLAKPLAMPLLAAWAWSCLRKQKLLLVILGFSWVGDIALLLMPDPAKPPTLWGISRQVGFFLGGIASFAVVQLLYIRVLFRWDGALPLWGYGLLMAYGTATTTLFEKRIGVLQNPYGPP